VQRTPDCEYAWNADRVLMRLDLNAIVTLIEILATLGLQFVEHLPKLPRA
jgi:hypothetical protein